MVHFILNCCCHFPHQLLYPHKAFPLLRAWIFQAEATVCGIVPAAFIKPDGQKIDDVARWLGKMWLGKIIF